MQNRLGWHGYIEPIMSQLIFNFVYTFIFHFPLVPPMRSIFPPSFSFSRWYLTPSSVISPNTSASFFLLILGFCLSSSIIFSEMIWVVIWVVFWVVIWVVPFSYFNGIIVLNTSSSMNSGLVPVV